MIELDKQSSPTKHEGWMVMRIRQHRDDIDNIADGTIFETRERAERYAINTCEPGCLIVPVTWEDEQ